MCRPQDTLLESYGGQEPVVITGNRKTQIAKEKKKDKLREYGGMYSRVAERRVLPAQECASLCIRLPAVRTDVASSSLKGQEFFAGPLGIEFLRNVENCTPSDARRNLAEGNPDTHQKDSLDRPFGDDVTDIIQGLYQ